MYLVSIVSSNDLDWTYSEPRLFEKKEDASNYFLKEVKWYLDSNENNKQNKDLIVDAATMITKSDCADIKYSTLEEIFDWYVDFTHEGSSLYFWNSEDNWAVTFEFHLLKQDGN